MRYHMLLLLTGMFLERPTPRTNWRHHRTELDRFLHRNRGPQKTISRLCSNVYVLILVSLVWEGKQFQHTNTLATHQQWWWVYGGDGELTTTYTSHWRRTYILFWHGISIINWLLLFHRSGCSRSRDTFSHHILQTFEMELWKKKNKRFCHFVEFKNFNFFTCDLNRVA